MRRCFRLFRPWRFFFFLFVSFCFFQTAAHAADKNIAVMNRSASISPSAFLAQKHQFINLFDKIKPEDEIALVVYDQTSSILLNGFETKDEAIAAVLKLQQGEYAAPESRDNAIQLAATVLREAADQGFIGRIVELSTDGYWDWHQNQLIEEHGAEWQLKRDGSVPDPKEAAFGVDAWKRKDIQAIYVLDTLRDMPMDAVDLSKAQDYSVMGWVDNRNYLYIAGEGGVMAHDSCSGLFAWYENAKVIDLGGNLHTEAVRNFKYMFYHCYELIYVNLSGIDTREVRDLTKMFVECKKLESVDLSSFQTENVTSMFAMFNKCESLKYLDLSTFQTINVETFNLAFANCPSLSVITWDRDRFSTQNAKSLQSMFAYDTSLVNVDVTGFTYGNVENTYQMFIGTPFAEIYGENGEKLPVG